MVRGRDACWEHCVLVDATRQKVRCNYCHREFSGGVYRMKFHLAQIRNKDIVPCAEVPDSVRDKIQVLVSNPKKQKTPKKLKVDVSVNGHQHSSSSASGGARPNTRITGQGGSTSPCLLSPQPSLSLPLPETNDVQKHKQDIADKKIAIFFFHNAIPFRAAKSIYYQEMVDAVTGCGVSYRAPSSVKLRSTLLEKVKGDINELNERLRLDWKETGCTILCSCCSEVQSLVVFSATCPKGSFFLKSVDIYDRKDDAQYLFELIESVLLEVGLENIVQVITDSTASYVYAGRLLMAKYSSLFWSPCASHCINKILEDFSKQEWISTVLKEADAILRLLYSHQVVSNMMRKFTGGSELIRPRISRFVSNFLSLRSIVVQEDNLKHMFSHPEWLSSSFSRSSESQAIRSLLTSDRFWKYAQEAVSVSEPLVKVLRIVDGDMPAMGYIYEGMERAKVLIKEYYKGIEEKYVPLWEIIDRRWNMQLHSPLHSAAAFLNPSIFYGLNFKVDSRMRNGFQEALTKITIEDKEKREVTKQHPLYINAQGALGTEFAIMGRTLNAPGDWWMAYGYEIPVLQRAAIRILSQPCSSHWCRWNWSTFESLHSKKLISEPDKFQDLVFVHCNLWLQAIARIGGDSRCEPIVFDEIDVSSQWPTESECSPALLDDLWLDNSIFE